MYRLKQGQESFEVVDGPAEGLRFQRGKVYDGKQIPKTEAWRFEKVPAAKPEKTPAPGTAADKQAAGTKKTVKTDKKGA
jgi:hypothetical protein